MNPVKPKNDEISDDLDLSGIQHFDRSSLAPSAQVHLTPISKDSEISHKSEIENSLSLLGTSISVGLSNLGSPESSTLNIQNDSISVQKPFKGLNNSTSSGDKKLKQDSKSTLETFKTELIPISKAHHSSSLLSSSIKTNRYSFVEPTASTAIRPSILGSSIVDEFRNINSFGRSIADKSPRKASPFSEISVTSSLLATPPHLPGLPPAPIRRAPANSSGNSSNLATSLSRSLPRSMPNPDLDSTASALNPGRRNYGTMPAEVGHLTHLSRSFKAGNTPSGSLRHEILTTEANLSRTGSPESVGMISNDDAVKIVSEHLISTESETGSTVSHNLLGGDVTRSIYQWQEKRLNNQQRRSSFPNIRTGREEDVSSPFRFSDLQEPGAFRRHFIRSRLQNNVTSAHQQRAPFLTNNFIDFLLLYGFYGGDVIPNDEDDQAQSLLSDSTDPGEHTPLYHPHTPTPRPPSIASVTGTSASKAYFMLLKAFVGTGVLFLPKAFANGGMLFSIVLMFVLGWLTLHCMLLLVETSRMLGGSFGDIGEYFYGPRMRKLVLASITVSQLAIFVPLSWVRKIKHFSWTSLVADVFILLGLSYIFMYDISELAKRGVAKDIVWMNYQSFPLFIGTAMFAFEGICLILPIAESMKRPDKFELVLTLCVLSIGVLFVTTGVMGYLTFGSTVSTIIFLDLPSDPPSKAVLTLQFFYAVAIILSFPLTVYPAIRITEASLFGVQDGKLSFLVKWQKNAYRAVLVALLAGVAWAGANNLDKFVSLVGCFACIPLSFIYPSLFHYHIVQNSWVKAKDMILVVFGTVAMFYTTWITLKQWVLESPDVPRNRCESNPNPENLFMMLFGLSQSRIVSWKIRCCTLIFERRLLVMNSPEKSKRQTRRRVQSNERRRKQRQAEAKFRDNARNLKDNDDAKSKRKLKFAEERKERESRRLLWELREKQIIALNAAKRKRDQLEKEKLDLAKAKQEATIQLLKKQQLQIPTFSTPYSRYTQNISNLNRN
ncbi:neutral amino acid transporter, partial [Nowakowskiella sp. JEL0078]